MQTIHRCDFCNAIIDVKGTYVYALTTVSQGGSQKNEDICAKCVEKLRQITATPKKPPHDTGVTPSPTDTPLQAAYRSGGVLWGQNET